LNGHVALSPELSLTISFTQAIANNIATLPRTRLDLAINYNLLQNVEEDGSVLTFARSLRSQNREDMKNIRIQAKHKLRIAIGLASAFSALFASLTFTSHAADSPTADEALKTLMNGNERFASSHPAYPHEGAARRAAVASGQHPIATILSCSDSRVTPEILFDEGIGDLIVVRVIGNIGGADEVGSIEYGVQHLGTPLLVVLGHSQCSAVTAAVTHAEVLFEGLQHN
jgi:hypothetical protein